jgi:hypothetical protein
VAWATRATPNPKPQTPNPTEDRVDKPRVGLLGIAGDEAWAKRATSKLAERTMSQFRDQVVSLSNIREISTGVGAIYRVYQMSQFRDQVQQPICSDKIGETGLFSRES